MNCEAIVEDQMESELFGYAGGAFSGALESGKTGLFEHANGGTLFLEEIGAIPLRLQVKLLRVLQEQKITRVGSIEPRKIDVRIIATTSQNLESLVEEGKFREDLFFRMNVIPITIPPLRERLEDIPALIKVYANQFSMKYKKRLVFTEDAMAVLKNNKWPGNIRELIYVLERIYATTSENSVTAQQLANLIDNEKGRQSSEEQPIVINKIMPLKKAVEELERQLIAKVGKTETSYRQIAKILEVSPSTIIRKVRKSRRGA